MLCQCAQNNLQHLHLHECIVRENITRKNIYFWAWSESPKTPPCPQFGQLGPLRFAHMTEFFDDDNDGCNDDYDDNYGKFDDNYEKND